jgi:gliding motility-associated-like protein
VRTKVNILVLWLLVFFPVMTSAQQAEYNMGSNWVYPTAQKFVGMDFINAASGSVINNGTILYSRNLTNNGIVNFVTTLATSPALSQFVGSAQQRISGSGSTRFYGLLFGSQLVAGAYSLEQNITVAHQVDFTKGIVTALQTTPETTMNMVQLEATATVANASDNSYVDGFVSKLGNSAFTFPIGDGGFYRPAAISAPVSITDCFLARYLYANPDNAGYTRSQKALPILQVSDKEYWVVNRTSGSANGQITLSWDVNKTSATLPTGLKGLSVARWDGAKWIDEGNILTTGNEIAGTVTANVTGYGVFTLATIIMNPPVAVDDNITSFEDVASTGSVLANDQVSNGTTLTVTNFSIAGTAYTPGSNATIPNVGTVTIASNGTYIFTPVLNFSGTAPTVTYTISDDANMTDTGDLIINVFALPELQKSSTKPVMNNDGTWSWTYILSVQNDTPFAIKSLQVKDNLDDVFKTKGCTYTITSITATGSLNANGLYNGSNNLNTLMDGLSLAANRLDSIRIEVKVESNSQIDSIHVFNQAVLSGTINSVNVSLLSDDNTVAGTQDPTETVIPADIIYIPDAISPNGDGINDNLVIGHDAKSKVELEIFNRDGSLVYKNSDYQDEWVGKGSNSWLGRDLVDGTYFISFKLINKSTGEIVTKGVRYITLRR